MRTLVALVLGAGLVCGTAACSADDPGPAYARVSFSEPSKPPKDVILSEALVSIPEGIAVRVVPVPIGDDDQPLQGEVAHVVLRSANPDVMPVLDGPEKGQVILIGAKRGATALIASIQGVDVDAIPVEVTAP
jgi:hypothetical protein